MGGIGSTVGVYGPTGNMVAMGNVLNKGLTIRADQAPMKRLLSRLIDHVQAGRIDPKALITHRVPLANVYDACRMFSARLDECIKPVLYPDNGRQENAGWPVRSPRRPSTRPR